jgi:hypothetical protein
MESTEKDRRAKGVRRVDYAALVEICGRGGETPAFEAEAVELSGRGMQVRTRFLPELGAPLVLRFEHEGKEAVVEGEVAWRREVDKGGEFGIRFTALDSASVQVLKLVCAGTEPATPDAAASDSNGSASKHSPGASRPHTHGAAVKLHIHGLGAPMKARVFESRGRRLHVGSQLEFLKVGRALELEDVEAGNKRAAEIDSVTVAIDPRTQIPQLVVALRYDGEDEDATPEPSVVGDDDGKPAASAGRPAARATAAARTNSDDSSDEGAEDDADEDSELEESEDLFKGRFAAWASNAGGHVQRGGASVAEFGRRASEGFARVFDAVSRRAENDGEHPRRRTSPGRSSVAVSSRGVERNGGKERLRAQRPTKRTGSQSAEPSRKRRVLVAAGAVLVLVSGAYPLFFAHDAERAPSTRVEPLAPAAQALPAVTVAAVPVAVSGAFPPPSALDPAAQLAAGPDAVAVDVPLFGPQRLSTLEAAPLSPPVEAAIDEVGMAQDQTFAKPVVPTLSRAVPTEESSATEPAKEPAGNSEWQAGKMHLPIVHRLRLDKEGSELKGTKTPSGFSVLVPGRKVMESGAQIAKRDDRILSVNVKNSDAGGQVVFRFRKDVPGYKVRLRNDYVEFFINSKQD